ncbi:hypothetical protein RclHR1_27480001 [Rhizophagus clarus]|nr:hypothetical protein RclHR1_27480001 [Rhizophagus clarus]
MFCPACNSAFQRKKSNTNSKSSILREIVVNLESNSNRNILENDELIHTKSNNIESDDDDLEITLPSKWIEIQVSLLDDILAEVHFYVEKLTGDKDIMHSDYSVSFKPEKATGVGSQLVDLQDYKKFLLDYKNLIEYGNYSIFKKR